MSLKASRTSTVTIRVVAADGPMGEIETVGGAADAGAADVTAAEVDATAAMAVATAVEARDTSHGSPRIHTDKIKGRN